MKLILPFKCLILLFAKSSRVNCPIFLCRSVSISSMQLSESSKILNSGRSNKFSITGTRLPPSNKVRTLGASKMALSIWLIWFPRKFRYSRFGKLCLPFWTNSSAGSVSKLSDLSKWWVSQRRMSAILNNFPVDQNPCHILANEKDSCRNKNRVPWWGTYYFVMIRIESFC